MKRRSQVAPTRSGFASACLLGAFAYGSVVAATATEISRLRSACDAVGQQILERNFIRSAVYQEQFSRYDPRTSRCYVEMRIQTGDPEKHTDRVGQYLYDGQTRELLAFAQIQNGRKSGRVFDMDHRTASFENSGWDDATEYINAMMLDNGR